MKVNRLPILLLLTAAVVSPARADVLVLKGGQRLEGDLVDKGKTFEIKAGDSVLSIAKTEVLRHVLSIEALTAEAEKIHTQARELYEQGIKPDLDPKTANEQLKKGVELLRKAADLYQEARDYYPETKQTLLDGMTVKLLQEMRLYRDKMSSEIAKSITPAPAPVEPKPEPEAKTPAPAPAPKAPVKAKPAKPDLVQLLPLAKAGDLEAMYAAGLILEVEEWKATEATRWFRAAADKGHARAMLHLGILALEGRGRKPDYKEAQGWFVKADAKSEPLAKVQMAKLQIEGIGGPRSLHRADDLCEKAAASLRKEAFSGDPEVSAALGWMHLEGLGTYQSGDKAVEFLKVAAEQGDVRALVMLGMMYDKGKGVTANRTEAVKAYKAAAEKGFGPGQSAYAEMHHVNFWRKSTPIQNEKLAREWFLKAVSQGEPVGMWWMGWFHIWGFEGPKEPKEAFRLWTEGIKIAPDKLRAQLLQDIGWCNSEGVGTPKDMREAMKYYKEGAELGNPMAQNNYAWYLDKDSHNLGESFKWYQLSAKQNFPDAALELGTFYREGKGIPKNLAEAERWYAVAVQLAMKGSAEKLKEVQQERAAGKR